MNQNRVELSRYRIERAEEDLKSAKLCLAGDSFFPKELYKTGPPCLQHFY